MMGKRLLMLLCVLAALVLPVFAAEPDVPAAQSEALDLDGLQSAGEQWAPGI